MPRFDTSPEQMTLFDTGTPQKVVNVASVPQRSPFRYPGGKTWFVPYIRQWLRSLAKKPAILIEPFAGGGIIGLTAVFENLADHVILVELDEQVAAVWKTILDGNAEWLIKRILSYEMNYDNVIETLSQTDGELREKAFRTILKNRTFHGGIMAFGSAPMKHGENGKGVKSRWYAETLANRIKAIDKIKNRLSIVCDDGIEIIGKYKHRKTVAYFIDPPYTAGGTTGKRAGKRLYTHHALDHEKLFATTTEALGPALYTYDNAPDVIELARKYGLAYKTVAMKNRHHAKMTELVVGKDLDWL